MTVVLVSKGILEEYQYFLVVLPDKTCIGFKSDKFFYVSYNINTQKAANAVLNSEKKEIKILHKSNSRSYSV